MYPNLYFDLVDIRLFLDIAETKHLTIGAAHSNMSAPAASTRIKKIESRLGTKLFLRGNRGVELTPAGQTFLHHGQLLLRQLDHLMTDLQEYAKGVKGHLRVFANTTAIEFLPAVLNRYLKTHPDVNVALQEQPSQDVVRAIIESKGDIGFVAGSVSTEGLEAYPYCRDRLVLATSLTHPLAQHETIPFEKTLDFNHITLVDTSAIQAFVNQAAHRLNRRLKIRIQVGNFEALCRMVQSDIGIGVLPESAARRHVKTMRIRVVHLSDSWAVRDLKICLRSSQSLPVFAREFFEMLIQDSSHLEHEQRSSRILKIRKTISRGIR